MVGLMYRDKLIKEARKAAANSYSPYSKFPVGAAVIVEDTISIYRGCNIENSSYGLTMCAERSAIFNAISDGHEKIIEIAISCQNLSIVSPIQHKMSCGACRQVMAEFMSIDGLIHIDYGITYHLKEILPVPFLFKLGS
jgi:cytidine deaminase